MHKRSGSVSNNIEGLHPGPELSLIRPMGTPNMEAADVFPPTRAQASSSIFLPFIPEDIAFEEEYEEYLSDMGFSSGLSEQDASFSSSSLGGAHTSAWQRLPKLVSDITDNISDSESIPSIEELDEAGKLLDPDRESGEVNENLNNWEVRCRFLRFH